MAASPRPTSLAGENRQGACQCVEQWWTISTPTFAASMEATRAWHVAAPPSTDPRAASIKKTTENQVRYRSARPENDGEAVLRSVTSPSSL